MNLKGKFLPSPENSPLEKDLVALLKAGLCCNNSRINPPDQEHATWSSLGDQTEAALKVAALKYGLDEEIVGMLMPRIHEIPFDARRKRMTTIHRSNYKETAYIKRRPERNIAIMYPYPGQ